jgi:hypothetical protein
MVEIVFMPTYKKNMKCDKCGKKIGKITYKSPYVEGKFCSSNCYVEEFIKQNYE